MLLIYYFCKIGQPRVHAREGYYLSTPGPGHLCDFEQEWG